MHNSDYNLKEYSDFLQIEKIFAAACQVLVGRVCGEIPQDFVPFELWNVDTYADPL